MLPFPRFAARCGSSGSTCPDATSWRWCGISLCLSKILKKEAFENAIRVNGAIGGSTNAVIHLLAIAGRIGVPLTLDDWDRIGRNTSHPRRSPCPRAASSWRTFITRVVFPRVIRAPRYSEPAESECGHRYRKIHRRELQGCPELERRCDSTAARSGCGARRYRRVTGTGAGWCCAQAFCRFSDSVCATAARRSVRTVEHYKERIIDPNLDVDENSVPRSGKTAALRRYPGMAKVLNMGLPPKLLARGVKDMVRVGCPYEWHRLRNCCSTCVPRGCCHGGPPGAGQGWRHH